MTTRQGEQEPTQVKKGANTATSVQLVSTCTPHPFPDGRPAPQAVHYGMQKTHSTVKVTH